MMLLLLLSTIVEHCRSKTTRGLVRLYLTTILTMFDNVIIVCAMDDIASPIVDHCQTLSF